MLAVDAKTIIFLWPPVSFGSACVRGEAILIGSTDKTVLRSWREGPRGPVRGA